MLKSKLSNYLIILCLMTFLAIFTFIVQKSYDNLMTATNQAKVNPIIKPIDPNLDTGILQQINSRQEIAAP